MSLGNMAGPLLSGILADMFSLRPIFYMGTGISVIGLIIYIILRPRGINITEFVEEL
jgi:MFS family permease